MVPFTCGRRAVVITRLVIIGLLALWSLCNSQTPLHKKLGFHFEYTDVFGPADVPMRLVITGREATLLRQRAIPETSGETIGVFCATVREDDLDLLERSFPNKVRSTTPLAPDAAHHILKIRSEHRNAELRIPHSPEGLSRIKDVVAEVERLEKTLLKHPYRTLRLELADAKRKPFIGRRFDIRVRLLNSGIRPIQLDLSAPIIWAESTPSLQTHPDPQVSPLPVVWDNISKGYSLKKIVQIEGGETREIPIPVVFQAPDSVLVRVHFERQGGLAKEGLGIAGSVVSNLIKLDVKRN